MYNLIQISGSSLDGRNSGLLILYIMENLNNLVKAVATLAISFPPCPSKWAVMHSNRGINNPQGETSTHTCILAICFKFTFINMTITKSFKYLIV